MPGHFQVKLGGSFKTYEAEEDKVLKRAFMAGFPCAKYTLRSQKYMYNFKSLKQVNVESGKERDIRPPQGWTQPSKPCVPQGQTMIVTVPKGKIGKTIEVPHPKDSNKTITVLIPKKAKEGQTMLVPVPPLSEARASDAKGKALAKAVGDPGSKSSTGKKVAVAGAILGGAGIAAAAGAGAVLVAEHGLDGAVDIVGDSFDAAGDWIEGAAESAAEWAEGAGEDIADWTVDAGEFLVDSGEALGDFVMDLF